MVKRSSGLSESTYFIPAALLDGPLHGHGSSSSSSTSGDRVRLPVGTLGDALDRLAANGLIEVERLHGLGPGADLITSIRSGLSPVVWN